MRNHELDGIEVKRIKTFSFFFFFSIPLMSLSLIILYKLIKLSKLHAEAEEQTNTSFLLGTPFSVDHHKRRSQK